MSEQIHIGSKGTEIRFPAGYMNRSMRRKIKKIKSKILIKKGGPK